MNTNTTKIFTALAIGVIAVSIPTTAFAANIGNMTFKDLIAFIITDFIRPVIYLIFSAAIVYFLWNIAEIIRAGKEGKELAELKTKALWGIIALFIMTSLWGLVQILVNTFVPGAGIPIMNTGGGGSTGGFNVSGGSTGGFDAGGPGASCRTSADCLSGSCSDVSRSGTYSCQ